jgi:hypothetical protein
VGASPSVALPICGAELGHYLHCRIGCGRRSLPFPATTEAETPDSRWDSAFLSIFPRCYSSVRAAPVSARYEVTNVEEIQEARKAQDEHFKSRSTTEKGEGVYATRSFMAGETVMEGVIEEVLSGNSVHASQIGENTYVLHGGLVPMVNHSCDPNCGIRVNETGAHDFAAIRDIKANEELTFDYAMRNYSVDNFPKICRCGTQICRGKITGWKDLPPERKAAYAGHIAPYLLDLDAKA